MAQTRKNTGSHIVMAIDDLSDAAANLKRYLDSVAGGNTFVADAVGTVPVTIEGFSTAQTGDLLDVLQNAAGNSIFKVATVSGAATGLKLTSAAAASGLAIAVTSSGADESVTIDAKGAGIVKLGTVSTGGVQISKIADATNVALGTATGTKIGTATNQKLGFFNSTPIVQPSVSGALSTVADAPAKAVLTSIIAALKAAGLGLVADTTT